MKIKIIDILNAIANGEQPPKKIIFRDVIYEYNEDEGDYYNHNFDALFDYHEITDILNEEVEILETTITYHNDILHFTEIENNTEKNKIKNLPYYDYSDLNMEVITQEECFRRELQHIEKRLTDYHNKINEIISRVNKLL